MGLGGQGYRGQLDRATGASWAGLQGGQLDRATGGAAGQGYRGAAGQGYRGAAVQGYRGPAGQGYRGQLGRATGGQAVQGYRCFPMLSHAIFPCFPCFPCFLDIIKSNILENTMLPMLSMLSFL